MSQEQAVLKGVAEGASGKSVRLTQDPHPLLNYRTFLGSYTGTTGRAKRAGDFFVNFPTSVDIVVYAIMSSRRLARFCLEGFYISFAQYRNPFYQWYCAVVALWCPASLCQCGSIRRASATRTLSTPILVACSRESCFFWRGGGKEAVLDSPGSVAELSGQLSLPDLGTCFLRATVTCFAPCCLFAFGSILFVDIALQPIVRPSYNRGLDALTAVAFLPGKDRLSIHNVAQDVASKICNTKTGLFSSRLAETIATAERGGLLTGNWPFELRVAKEPAPLQADGSVGAGGVTNCLVFLGKRLQPGAGILFCIAVPHCLHWQQNFLFNLVIAVPTGFYEDLQIIHATVRDMGVPTSASKDFQGNGFKAFKKCVGCLASVAIAKTKEILRDSVGFSLLVDGSSKCSWNRK